MPNWAMHRRISICIKRWSKLALPNRIMNSEQLSDEKIIASWHKNALPWIKAVREKKIESRRQVTDQALMDAVLACSPGSVLDLGCGEGWLLRELASRNIQGIGTDVVPALIEQAQRAGGGDFRLMSYEEIAAGTLMLKVDVVVSNFALLGKESVEGLFQAIPSLLKPQGTLIVQTLQPEIACGDHPYQDGWRAGSWAGFSDEFVDPAPWYFRTLDSWRRLFVENGMRLRAVHEPLHPNTQKSASIIFIGEVA